MQNNNSIRDRVAEVIREKLELDKKPEINECPSDLGADELDQVEIVMALEDEFEIEILDDDPMLEMEKTNGEIEFAYKLKNVATIADRVNTLLQSKT